MWKLSGGAEARCLCAFHGTANPDLSQLHSGTGGGVHIFAQIAVCKLLKKLEMRVGFGDLKGF